MCLACCLLEKHTHLHVTLQICGVHMREVAANTGLPCSLKAATSSIQMATPVPLRETGGNDGNAVIDAAPTRAEIDDDDLTAATQPRMTQASGRQPDNSTTLLLIGLAIALVVGLRAYEVDPAPLPVRCVSLQTVSEECVSRLQWHAASPQVFAHRDLLAEC